MVDMNYFALKKADPYAKDIVDCAPHVALYTFEENEWEKTNIEGNLFVYNRNGEPFHSLAIMNKLNTNNLIEPVYKGLELQLKEPFLLYRNSKCRIYGIWFYDKQECVRVATKLQSLVKESTKQLDGPDNSPPTPGYGIASTNCYVDIFSMLSKAQDDYNSNKGMTGNKGEVLTPRAPDMTSQSVMDFFAKAGCGGGGVQLPPIQALPSPGIFLPRPTDAREGPLLLQRLMSNPAHSVEHIEKQQRSVTPQESIGMNGNGSLGGSLQHNAEFTLADLTPIEKQRQGNHQPQSGSAKKARETNGPIHLEGELNFMHVSSPMSSSPLATYLNQSQDNRTKPALMPPTMFTATTAEDSHPTPEPLTRNQLLQAFNYLLKHDADFVNKLHEAYVKSFLEKPFSVS